MNKVKYLLVYTIPLATVVAFMYNGIWSWTTVLYAFVILPFIDHVMQTDSLNLTKEESEEALNSRYYNIALYGTIPVQIGFVVWFTVGVLPKEMSSIDMFAKTFSMGAMGSVLAINSAHEIGHRVGKLNKLLSKLLLTSVLYVHFFEEHNYGHHKNVGTYDDPATARRGEWLYTFVFRSIVMGWIGAWKIERKRLNRKGGSAISFKNEVLVWQVLQIGVVAAIYHYYGLLILGCFTLASFFSVFILEAINYIEHYGLTREKVSEYRYEKVTPCHSWNADNQIGRAVLFELTRHSDHHENPSKPYQVLVSPGNTPQLPTGYPGMILLSLLPPLFFSIMHKRIDTYNG